MGVAVKLSEKPSVFDYHDYRLFLSETFNYLKANKSGFSIRNLARQVGVSPGYFTMVIKERSPLSPKILTQLGPYLELSQEEVNYCSHLAALNDSKSIEEQRLAFRKISRMGLYKSKHQQAILAYQYFSNWYYVAIRELANNENFTIDPKWISENLTKKIPLTQIREALEFLKKYQLIVIENGKYRASDTNMLCDGEIYRIALTEFYKQTYQICIDSIYEIPREERHLASHSFTLTEEGFEQLQNIIQNTISQLQKLTEVENKKNNEKRVYHVSLAAIPMSKKGIKK